MKKLLYITDQQEYSEHGTIGPLFNGYLKQYVDVHIVYFTRFKHSFQIKESDYVVPDKYKKEICCYLASQEIDLGSYDVIFVRNMEHLLKDVLDHREQYGYKVGFRASFPKTVEYYEVQKAEAKASWLSGLNTWLRTAKKRKLIQRCDLFMPTSKDMQEAFYGGAAPLCFPLPAGLDPARIQTHNPAPHDETRFVYVGTLDKLRRFEEVLQAFTRVAPDNWSLTIATFDLSYARNLLAAYPTIESKVTLLRAEGLDALRDTINACDVGLALLPHQPLFDTSIPSKVMEYYTCAVPALVTDNGKNRMLFDDGEALFSAFEPDAIVDAIESAIVTPREAIAAVGEAGQQKILGMKRNYEIMAHQLAEVIEAL